MASRGIAELMIVAAMGAGIGATLSTPAYRLSVRWGEPPRYTCSSCAQPSSSGVGGWVRLGASCVACGARNGPHPWLMSVVTAVLCTGIVMRFGFSPQTVPFVLLVPLGCLLAAIDIACLRLPSCLVYPAIVMSVALFAGLALIMGRWDDGIRMILGGLAMGFVYLLLALLPGGQMGLGDVTLGVLLGVYLGWMSWSTVILGAVLPFVVNAPFAIGLLIAGKAGRKTDLPFGPAMLSGAYVAIVGPWLLRTWAMS